MSKEYSKDYFTLVQENDRLVDQPLKTKQLTFFQDAMVRFGKNKYNVIATVILATLILLSILIPIITPKNLYEEQNPTLKYLPPRFPLIEKLGVLNGYRNYIHQYVDISTIDPETNLGYPSTSFDPELIDMDTLTNYYVEGTDKLEAYVGGTVNLAINKGKQAYSMISEEKIRFVTGDIISVDVVDLVGNGVVQLYLSPSKLGSDALGDWNNLTLLGEVDAAGVVDIDPMLSVPSNTNEFLVVKYELPNVATDTTSKAIFNSITITNEETVKEEFSGFSLSMFGFFTVDSVLENGSINREGARALVADFSYDQYTHIFGPKEKTISGEEYAEILAANPGMEDAIIADPESTTTWEFDGNYPIIRVKDVISFTHPTQGTFYTYIVDMDGAQLLGMESRPYFIFGTDSYGRDVLSLIFLGLRTSLILGFIAAAINITLGVVWGSTSAYYGGQVDILMERFVDIWGSFPQITMISILTVLFGRGFLTLLIFMTYDGWIPAAAVTRLQFYRYKGREYVLAARTLGASDRRIIFKHILPNALGTIVTRTILSIPRVIFLETTLSFLGLGVGDGQVIKIGPINLTGTSIGVILAQGRSQILTGNLWLIVFPAIIVSILMITFNMFGNALRDALNPQLRGTS